jgi:hypothetical protein
MSMVDLKPRDVTRCEPNGVCKKPDSRRCLAASLCHIASDRQGRELLSGDTGSGAGAESRLLLRLTLGTGLTHQVDECAGLEWHVLAVGIEQIERRFLHVTFR